MILGIGSDILNISRLDKILLKHNKKFILRFYGKKEIEILNKKAKNLNSFLGKRFAVKEAVWKALSPKRGLGLKFKEIQTLNTNEGQPYLFFSGTTKKFIQKKEIDLQAKLNFNVSISDEPPYVLAFVVISLAPCV